MKIHALEIGQVKITKNWQQAPDSNLPRLVSTLLDTRFTDWLPIYSWVIEHPEGVIVVDTGIPLDANKLILFPPFMPLVQRAAPFRITEEQLLTSQLKRLGISTEDVRWVIQTHLHQDHDGEIGKFPNAEVIISHKEWEAGIGFGGRMAGYLNWRWENVKPTLIDFSTEQDDVFAGRYTVTQAGDVFIVPTPGHSAGHMSVIVEDGDRSIFLAGDASYTDELLIHGSLDGVSVDPDAVRDTHHRILRFARTKPTIYLPSHDPEAMERLEHHQPLFTELERIRG